MGVGRLDPSSGIDVWLRAVHTLRSTCPDASTAWLRIPGEHSDSAFDDAIAHERWHLGLDDAIEIVEPGQIDALAARAGAATVVMVTARPPVDGATGDDGSWGTALDFARAARATLVAFRAIVVPLSDLAEGEGRGEGRSLDVDVELVDYPDVEALAAAAAKALALTAGEPGITPT